LLQCQLLFQPGQPFLRGRIFLFAQALISPIVGWLLDRIPAQIVMTVAALATAAGYLWASNVHSFAPMVTAFAVIGAAVELVSRQLRTGRPETPGALEPVITRLMLGALDRGRRA